MWAVYVYEWSTATVSILKSSCAFVPCAMVNTTWFDRCTIMRLYRLGSSVMHWAWTYFCICAASGSMIVSHPCLFLLASLPRIFPRRNKNWNSSHGMQSCRRIFMQRRNSWFMKSALQHTPWWILRRIRYQREWCYTIYICRFFFGCWIEPSRCSE